VPEAPPVPAADSGPVWERLLPRLKEKFPPGTVSLLSDPLQVGVRETAEGLLLTMKNAFSATMVARPDVLQSLSALATETAGRHILVRTGAADAPETQRSTRELDRKLDELKKFTIVQFKDENTEGSYNG
jgi:hypothetical protein